MIILEREEPAQRGSAYASLRLRTIRDRCLATALATVSLTSSLILLGAWIGTHTLSYSREVLFYRRICSDIEQTLGPFNFPTTVLCILGSYLVESRQWRILFALCSLIGTICYCLIAFQGQMVRE